MEIALLKEIVGFQDKPNPSKIPKEQHGDPKMEKLSTRMEHDRQKRPYRLLPPHHDALDGDTDNRKGTIISSNGQFYGPPTGCTDLSLLGYTLNGFYQVKSSTSANNIEINNNMKLDTVFCAFNQPEGSHNPSFVENRIISRRDTNKIVFHVERSTDFELDPMNPYITFDMEHVNLGNAFNAKSGIYTVPKSGLYLLFFKGMAIFPSAQQKNSMNNNNIFINLVELNFIESIGMEVVNTKKESHYIEFGKLGRMNRGDMIRVSAKSSKLGIKFSAKNISFTGYLFEE